MVEIIGGLWLSMTVHQICCKDEGLCQGLWSWNWIEARSKDDWNSYPFLSKSPWGISSLLSMDEVRRWQ